MMSNNTNLKELASSSQVQSVRYCRDTYEVATADGKKRKFFKRNFRFKTDPSDDGPAKGAPALVSAGMMGDRADVIFAMPEELGSSSARLAEWRFRLCTLTLSPPHSRHMTGERSKRAFLTLANYPKQEQVTGLRAGNAMTFLEASEDRRGCRRSRTPCAGVGFPPRAEAQDAAPPPLERRWCVL